jgi:hypothetical protein
MEKFIEKETKYPPRQKIYKRNKKWKYKNK